MSQKRCSTCGQCLPLPLPETLPFRGLQRRIIELVHRAGATGLGTDALCDLLYQDDPDGGPDNAKGVISVHIWHINQRFNQFDLQIMATGHGGRGEHEYRIVTCDERRATEQKRKRAHELKLAARVERAHKTLERSKRVIKTGGI